jgi:DNA recombination protein RmuC
MEIFLILFLIIIAVVIILQIWQAKHSPVDLFPLTSKLEALQNQQERTDRLIREEISNFRMEMQTQARGERAELKESLKSFGDSVRANMSEIAGLQHDQMEAFTGRLSLLTASNEQKLDAVRCIVDEKLKQIQEDNTRQLDRMRETVEEKLQGTLEKRLGDSFRQVSERLELVHQGLGDMRNLAVGVGDLKKVLTNIKTRGTWGEVQLGALLAEILAPDQYILNARIHEHSGDVVEFAIKLPGNGDWQTDHVLIPVDAKFPIEDYTRLIDAQERADIEAAEIASRLLETRIKNEAKDISKKYLAPPRTTDFGIMFLPSEGLFAEVIHRTDLVQFLQRENHIVVSGPSTFASFLNSLQMGFRSLAIQKRSGEVWKILGETKNEFEKFGLTLDAVRKKLEQATNSMDDVQKKSRTIQRKLRSVQDLPENSCEKTNQIT